MFDVIEKAVHLYFVIPGQYSFADIHTVADQVVVPINPRLDNYEAYCPSLSDPFGNYKCDYARGMMKPYFPPMVCLERAVYTTSVGNVHSVRILEYSYCMVNFGKHYPRCSVEIQRTGTAWNVLQNQCVC